MIILLLGRYQFPISTEFSKNEYCPNAIFEYLPNIVIVHCPNNRSIIFATWVLFLLRECINVINLPVCNSVVITRYVFRNNRAEWNPQAFCIIPD